MSGIGFIGDINQSLFYPISIVFALFSPGVALNVTIIIQLLVGYVGMYLLARALKLPPILSFLSGCLWMLSTQVLGTVHNLSTLQTLPWLPMVVWMGMLVGKKFWAPPLFSLIVLVQFSGGYPQYVLYGVFAAMAFSWFLQRQTFVRWLCSWMVAGLFTMGVSAFLWMPFVEQFFQSTRMVQTLEQAQMGSLHPAMLVKMIVPAFFDNAKLGMKWGPAWTGQPNWSFYFGWLSLVVLALRVKHIRQFDREEWFLIATICITLLLSLGAYLPGYELLQKILPILVWGRGPSILMIITAVTMILWIAKSLEKIRASRSLISILLVGGIVTLVGLLALWIVTSTQMENLWQYLDFIFNNALSLSQFHTLEKDQIILQSILSSMSLAAFFFVMSLLALWYRRSYLVVVFIIFDVLLGTQHMFQFAPLRAYDMQKSWKIFDLQQYRVLSRNGNAPYADFGAYWEAMVVREPFSDSFIDETELRTFEHLQSLRDGLTLDWNMIAKVPMIHGYTALLPKDYGKIWERDNEQNINLIDYVSVSDSKLADWSVKYYLVDRWYPAYGEKFLYPEQYRDDRWSVYLLPALPRFRYPDGTAVELENFQENPNEISFKTINATAHTQMIVADRWDANWRATVNGKEVTVENSNGMRQMELPQGYAEVKLWFYPEKFYLGLKISVITIVGMLAWVSWRRFRSGLRFAE